MYIVRAYNYNIFHSCCVWINGIRSEVLLYCHAIEYYCTTLNLENTGYYLSSVTGDIKADLPANSQAVLIPLHIYWVARTNLLQPWKGKKSKTGGVTLIKMKLVLRFTMC